MSDMQAEPAEATITKDIVVDATDDGEKTATVYSVTNDATGDEHFEATVKDDASGVGVTMSGPTADEALSGALTELQARLADQVAVVDPIEEIKFVEPPQAPPAP